MIELPDYKLNEEISQDYHSFLYRGTRKSDNKPVLIETFLTEFDTPIQAAQFRQEFSIIKNLKSEGFIKAYDTQNFRDGLALILEDFPGEPLYKNINILHNDIIKFLFVAIQLSKALSEIHHANIIHKEIKPKNIFLNQDTGVVKFIGPGLSSILTRENEHIYNPDVLHDSLPYMSPEQTGRMNRTMDYRTDFYSLGVVFYEIMTGTLPFYSDNPLELFHSHIAITPEAPIRINSKIPEAISSIIMKMLAKNPEDRYQSAGGLKADLEECLNQIETTGKIKPFLPGIKDISDKLNIPQKIYGRDKEISLLMAAFDRVSRSASELTLVSGYAGIGKTALINEIHKPIVQQKGYFISGKFDRLQLNMPYSAIIQAFKDLIRQILTEDQHRIKKWRAQFNEGLGNNGRIITDVIPELKLIIGEQPEVQDLGFEESQNRFNLVFRTFVNIIAEASHALVIFLDDLQWADSASLNLLEV
ncbi:MAG: AAA family ATPase, partial [Spirochaetota bacterium]|nr:AAA family ATPase [Spirochaetota bacterium]